MTILLSQYFNNKPHSIRHEANANLTLAQVNLCHAYAAEDGKYEYWIDPDTGTQISGSRGGTGGGGFRLMDEAGAIHSAHKDACAIDTFDPHRIYAQWCLDNQAKLKELGLYMEDPRWTGGWVHQQIIAPRSGLTVYIPFDPLKVPPPYPALRGQKPI